MNSFFHPLVRSGSRPARLERGEVISPKLSESSDFSNRYSFLMTTISRFYFILLDLSHTLLPLRCEFFHDSSALEPAQNFFEGGL